MVPQGHFESPTRRLTYHFDFRRHLLWCSWSGLSLHRSVFRFRRHPSSLYTFRLVSAWLGIAILQGSPNLSDVIRTVSCTALLFFLKSAALPLSYWGIDRNVRARNQLVRSTLA